MLIYTLTNIYRVFRQFFTDVPWSGWLSVAQFEFEVEDIKMNGLLSGKHRKPDKHGGGGGIAWLMWC